MGLIKDLLPIILNIGFLLITFLWSCFFIIFTLQEVHQETFIINITQIITITIQYSLLMAIQKKYKQELSLYEIYKRTRFLNIVSTSILWFVSLLIEYMLYAHAIYFFIQFLIYSLLIKKMRIFILIQVLCILAIYLFANKTVIDGITVKNYIRNIYN